MIVTYIFPPEIPDRYAGAFQPPVLADQSTYGTFATCVPLGIASTTYRSFQPDCLPVSQARPDLSAPIKRNPVNERNCS